MLRYGGIWINSKGIEKKKEKKKKRKRKNTTKHSVLFYEKKNPFLKKERK